MPNSFLTAEWRNLLMANYAVDPGVLLPYLPCHTELDSFNNIHYVSLVGFLFKDTRLLGIPIPFHQTFEEVNLRFYVRYKEGNIWKRGVVFVREIVPKRMITFVANTLYGEKYSTHPMKHSWIERKTELEVRYSWKVENDWNYIKAVARKETDALKAGSEEEFITEHYWGYTFISGSCTGQYEVAHPSWRIHQVTSYDIHCDAGKLYGPGFSDALQHPPRSVFLAEGSPIKVMKGARLYSI
jgi:hypothetical protein